MPVRARAGSLRRIRHYGDALVRAVRVASGQALMVEAVRDVDSTYDNLLNKVYTRAGNMQMARRARLPPRHVPPLRALGRAGPARASCACTLQVVVGEREMAVHSDFSLYLRTIESDLSFSQASAHRSAAR